MYMYICYTHTYNIQRAIMFLMTITIETYKSHSIVNVYLEVIGVYAYMCTYTPDSLLCCVECVRRLYIFILLVCDCLIQQQ